MRSRDKANAKRKTAAKDLTAKNAPLVKGGGKTKTAIITVRKAGGPQE